MRHATFIGNMGDRKCHNLTWAWFVDWYTALYRLRRWFFIP